MARNNTRNQRAGNPALEQAIMAELEQDDKDLIQLARRRFVTTQSAWNDIRLNSVQDQRFYAGEQYDESFARAARARGGQPQIQINMLPTFVQQVENNFRQQNVGLVVHATDEKGSEETAEILQGMLRHIEHISNAKQAYLWAAGAHGALVPGFGFIKIETDYTGPLSFDQEIYIRGIKDPMKILPDFMAEMPDFSDAQFWYEFQHIDRDEYKEKYSDSKLSQPTFADWTGLGTTIGTAWMKNNVVTVAKYWYKEQTVRHLAAFADGTIGFLDDYGVEIDKDGDLKVVNEELNEAFPRESTTDLDREEWYRAQWDAYVDTGAPQAEFPITMDDAPVDKLVNVIKTREVVFESVKWIITNGIEILDRGEWHDSEFPFVAVIGKDQVVDGKRDMHGIIRYAKDSQKMYNFLTSQIVRKVDASNKSAWIAPMESIPEPQRKRWELSNIENFAVLYFNAYTEDGKQLPPPQRGDAIEPAIQALLAGGQKFSQDIKSTIGIYEAGLGQAMGDRQSGTAIQTLAQNGEMSNFHFSDNFVLSMKRLGCLLLRLIPKVYDTARTVRIVGPDDEPALIKINQMFTQGGQQKKIDVTANAGYDVVVDTGPTFASKKAEQSESMIKFGAIEPQLMPVIADLIAGNMDWDVGGAVKDRIQQWQAANMPYIHPDNDQDTPLPPQARAVIQQAGTQLAQAHKQIAGLSQANQQMKWIIDSKQVENQGKERQLQIKAITDLALKKLDILSDAMQSKDQMRIEMVRTELEHITNKQKVHLKAIELHDQAIGQQNQDLYDQLQQQIDAQTASAVAPQANT